MENLPVVLFIPSIGIPARADCKQTELQAIVLWHIEANLRKQKYNSNKLGSFMESHYLSSKENLLLYLDWLIIRKFYINLQSEPIKVHYGGNYFKSHPDASAETIFI